MAVFVRRWLILTDPFGSPGALLRRGLTAASPETLDLILLVLVCSPYHVPFNVTFYVTLYVSNLKLNTVLYDMILLEITCFIEWMLPKLLDIRIKISSAYLLLHN